MRARARLRQRCAGGVSCFCITTSSQLAKIDAQGRAKRIGIFKIYRVTDREIVLGEDDSHLDFQLSAFCEPSSSAGEHRLVLSTVVHCHNRMGRIYIFIIEPFHKLVVRASLKRAARVGWPLATSE